MPDLFLCGIFYLDVRSPPAS